MVRKLQATKNQRRCRSLVEAREGGSEAVALADALAVAGIVCRAERGRQGLCCIARTRREDGAPGLEAYGAAKAALYGLSHSLARSAGPAGILTS
jgi:NAD(P)-dependent dehydrogenase (short-subunit alcohol dehydrogenase family)